MPKFDVRIDYRIDGKDVWYVFQTGSYGVNDIEAATSEEAALKAGTVFGRAFSAVAPPTIINVYVRAVEE
jgi:hypothetical protein